MDLYYGKGLHRKALLLLTKRAKSASANMPGYAATVRYLSRLGPEHFELILEFSQIVLEHDPAEGIKVRFVIYSC